MVKEANFIYLIDLVNPYLPDAMNTSKEETVRLIITHASNGQYDSMPVSSTLNNFAAAGISRTAAKKILKFTNKETSSLEEYFNEIGADQLTLIANKLKKDGISTDVYRGKVPALLSKLFYDEFEKVANRKNKRKQKISSHKNEEGKIDIRSGAHQYIRYIHDKEEIDVDGISFKLSPHLMSNEAEVELTLPYCVALFEAYSEKVKQNITAENIEDSEYMSRFKRQQRWFNEAAWYERSLRDTVVDFDNQYNLLKHDVYEGIEPVYHDEDFGTDGIKRLKKVQQQVVILQLDRSNLKNIDNILGNDTKKGLCHVLVNDGKIKSWVKVDDYDEVI